MHTIYITAEDNARLRLLLMLMPYSSKHRKDVANLRCELDRAVVVDLAAAHAPPIQIGSGFEFLDLRSGHPDVRTLCLPDDVLQTPNGLSVLSPFGAAVLGCLAGHEVAWVAPAAVPRILIRSVIPPPSASRRRQIRSERKSGHEQAGPPSPTRNFHHHD